MDDAAASKGGLQGRQWRRQLTNAASDFGRGSHIHIVLGKVDTGFEQGDQFNQRLLYGRNTVAECAPHLAGGQARLGERLRFNQIADGFSLGKVDAAGKKGALGKLAGFGQPRTQIECPAQQQLKHHGRTVRGDFNHVFSCIGVGRREVCDHGFVDTLAIWLSIEHIGKARARVLHGLVQVHELRAD